MEFLKHNVDYVIIGILGLMSFVVVWLTIERLIFYANVKFENYKHHGRPVSSAKSNRARPHRRDTYANDLQRIYEKSGRFSKPLQGFT